MLERVKKGVGIVKAVEAVIVLAFVLVDDLRNALIAFLVVSDVATLALLLAIVFFVSRSRNAFGSVSASLQSLESSLSAPFSKLKSSIDL